MEALLLLRKSRVVCLDLPGLLMRALTSLVCRLLVRPISPLWPLIRSLLVGTGFRVVLKLLTMRG